MAEPYGKELILDLRDCDPETMNRGNIRRFMERACAKMEVEACDLHFWDDEGLPAEECQTDPKKKGVSAVQFLLTSSIVLHALELRREVYLNMFSCETFNDRLLVDVALRSFGGRIVSQHVVHRGLSDRTAKADPDDLAKLIVGLERVETLCDWAIARIDHNGEVRAFDPDGTAGLMVDYQDIRDAVMPLEADVTKIGL